jgi:hypothetical protein
MIYPPEQYQFNRTTPNRSPAENELSPKSRREAYQAASWDLVTQENYLDFVA